MEAKKTDSRKKTLDELIDVLLKRAGLTKKEVYDTAIRRWANNNLDLLNQTELSKYRSVIL